VNYGWEQLTERVRRARLPFLDVTVGLVHGSGGVLLVDTGTKLAEARAISPASTRDIPRDQGEQRRC
jgi:hypothetical protein